MKTLKPFQIEDGDHIAKRMSALVAHEPRVGKSGCAIRAANVLGAKIVVVAAPAQACPNWRIAINDFREGDWWCFIVSYNKVGEFLQRWRRHADGLMIDVLVLDESHQLKTRDTSRTVSVYGKLMDGRGGLIEHATRVYCLTGTPQPNDPTELYPMLRAIAPGLIQTEFNRPMTFTQFKYRYCKMANTGFGLKIVGSKNYIELKQRMKGFVLRRTRAEVFGRDVQPPSTIYVDVKKSMQAELEALQGSPNGQRVIDAIHQGGLRSLGKLDASATALRRFYGLAKVPAMIEMISLELDEDPDKKQVVFCFHKEVIDALVVGLKRYGAVAFDGRTSRERKIRIEKDFKTDKKMRVVIGQLQSMSLGLDFSAADDCLFVESSWVGDDNEQAASRVFNLNKPRPVFRRFAVLRGSYDEDIASACVRKLAMSSKMFD